MTELARTTKESLEPRVQRIIGRLRSRLEALYGERMEKLVLFGSCARGEAEPDSDIDVMVALRDPVDVHEEILRSEHIVAALSLEFDTVLSCAFVSTSRFDAEQSPLLINVRHEGVAI